VGFYSDVGLLAIASRLKTLSDRLYGVADQTYRRHGIGLQARWFPVLRFIHDQGPSTVGDIAGAAGLTHSAVSQLAGRLVRDGWLVALGDDDRRKTRLDLTAKARLALREAKPLWHAIRDELEARCAAKNLDVWATLDGLAAVLDDNLPDAIAERVLLLQSGAVAIVPFRPELKAHFYRLNADWLQRYFYLEEVDHRVLSDPEGEILAGGGAIFFAVAADEVLGTCALALAAPGEYELTKMAVDPAAQGLGLGRRLIETAIAEFERRDGRLLFLETNTRLAPAIRLYESSGFEHQPSLRPGSHYQRANVYMVWRGRPAAVQAA
jgi:ribosomal protein S18 acetylase RimI-like enzyme